jgi:DNA-binding transcriptional LysR family regulator
MMEIRDLQYFESVAEHLHFGRAAEQLCRSQPAVTKAINRLEASLNVKLFIRHNTKVTLTDAGAALLKHAVRVRRAVEDTHKQAQALSVGTTGHIRIGAAPTMAQFLLPNLCKYLFNVGSDITLEARINTSRRLRELLENDEVDVLLGPTYPLNSVFNSTSIVDDHVVVVAAKGHSIFKRKKITLNDLLEFGWVLPFASDATEEREWLNGVFKREQLGLPRVQIETDSVTLLPRLMAETQLLSFITRRNLGAGRIGAPLREVKIEGTALKRSFGLLYKKDVYLTPAVERLIALVQSCGHEMLSDI